MTTLFNVSAEHADQDTAQQYLIQQYEHNVLDGTDPFALGAGAARTLLTPAIVKAAVHDPVASKLLAGNTSCPPSILEELTRSPFPDTADVARAHPRLPYDLIAGDPRYALAHPDAAPDLIAYSIAAYLGRTQTHMQEAEERSLLRSPRVAGDQLNVLVNHALTRNDLTRDVSSLLSNPNLIRAQAGLLFYQLNFNDLLLQRGMQKHIRAYLANPRADSRWLLTHADTTRDPDLGERARRHPNLTLEDRQHLYDRAIASEGTGFDIVVHSGLLLNPSSTGAELERSLGALTASGHVSATLIHAPNTTRECTYFMNLHTVDILDVIAAAYRWTTTRAAAQAMLALSSSWIGSLGDLLDVAGALHTYPETTQAQVSA